MWDAFISVLNTGPGTIVAATVCIIFLHKTGALQAIFDFIMRRNGYADDEEHIPHWAQDLQQHFNHETTSQNNQVIQELQMIKKGQDDVCKKIGAVVRVTEDTRAHVLSIRTDGVSLKGNGSKK